MWQSPRIGAALESVMMCSVVAVDGSTCEMVATCSTWAGVRDTARDVGATHKASEHAEGVVVGQSRGGE